MLASLPTNGRCRELACRPGRPHSGTNLPLAELNAYSGFVPPHDFALPPIPFRERQGEGGRQSIGWRHLKSGATVRHVEDCTLDGCAAKQDLASGCLADARPASSLFHGVTPKNRDACSTLVCRAEHYPSSKLIPPATPEGSFRMPAPRAAQ